jgi:hypothetical protein
MAMMLCCYCKEIINFDDELAIRMQIFNWKTSEIDSASQKLFAHSECFGTALHPTVPFDAEILL